MRIIINKVYFFLLSLEIVVSNIGTVKSVVMTLVNLKKLQRARIKTLPSDLVLSARLMEQGFVPNTIVEMAHSAPFNGPVAFFLHGTKVSIQHSLAAQIKVEPA